MKSDKRDLSLYVHIPFCKAKCSYCDFLSFGGCEYSLQKEYIAALCREMEAYQDIAGGYIIRTIFIGGGTPSYVNDSFLEQVLQTIFRVFEVDPDAEITMEGNPDSLTKDKLVSYRRMGINRLSIGLQSANDDMLRTLGRVHNYDQFIAAYSNARQAGFTNINIDLMSGLPGETAESYVKTLAKVAKLQPEHISAYSLIVEDGTPLSENEELLEQLPSEEEDRQLYVRTKILLGSSKYNRYEISNYAKPGYECKHNIVYWTGEEYLGLGLGASSYLTICMEEEHFEKVRFHGMENLDEYIGRFSNLTEDRMYEDNFLLAFIRDYYKELQFIKRKDEMEEFMFLGLRLMQGVSKEEFHQRFQVPIESIYGTVIQKYIDRGLLLEAAGRIYLSEQGIDVSNMVMAEFLL